MSSQPTPTPTPTPDPAKTADPTLADPTGEETSSSTRSPQQEGPDRDTPAWEGSEPDDAVGLVDPRREIPNPPGL